MENSVIAVQIANGTFVPVLNTSSNKRRRLVVTTVRDNQTNVKIELFRGSDESMSDPEYVGSLIIENIEPTGSGGPDISVLLGVDDSGNLNATATDTSSGEYQSLSVGLDQLEQEGGYDVPDFDLATPSELDELTLDEPDELTPGEPAAEEPGLEELSLDDEDDFDLSSLELEPDSEAEGESESQAESATPEPLEPSSTDAPPEPESEASEDIFSFDEEPLSELGADDSLDSLDELSLDDEDDFDLSSLELEPEPEPEAEPEGAPEPATPEPEPSEDTFSLDEPEELTPGEPAAEEPGLEELSLDDEDDFDLSSLDLEPEPETESEGAPQAASPEPEPSEDIFSLDEPDELTLGESASEEPGLEELSLDDEGDFDVDLSSLDLDTEPQPEPPELSSTEAQPEPQPEASEDDFSFDDDGLGDLSFDDLDSEETPGEAPEELSSEELSLDELSTPNADETAALTDIADEEFSLDESLSFESEEPADLDLGALSEEEGDFSMAADDLTAESGLDEGLVEADLGDEDFTFDEGVEDEPLFPEPEPLEDDTLSPEEFDRLDSQPLPSAEPEPVADEAMQPRRSNAIIFVGYMVLALAALGVVTYLVFRLMEGPPAPPLRAGLLDRLSSAWVLLGVPVVRRRRKG